MDNQFSSGENLTTSQITSMSGVNEVNSGSGGVSATKYIHAIILILMVIFAIFVVGIAVFNFNGLVHTQNAQVTNYSSQVQKLTR